MRIDLPSIASASTRCAECDGPLDAVAARCCIECEQASLLQRLADRYDDRGHTPLFDNGRICLVRIFHPLRWRFGIELGVDHCGAGIAIAFGPWALGIGYAR